MITTGIGYGLSGLVGAGIVVIGARFLLAPPHRGRSLRGSRRA